jgi:hypothetical protein
VSLAEADSISATVSAVGDERSLAGIDHAETEASKEIHEDVSLAGEALSTVAELGDDRSLPSIDNEKTKPSTEEFEGVGLDGTNEIEAQDAYELTSRAFAMIMSSQCSP